MPATLPNLYCTPQDVYDLVGAEGVDLRLDDQQQSTGNKILAVADAAANDTTLSVAAIGGPLIRGTTLQFAGGGMDAQAQVVLNATMPLGSTTLTVNPLPAGISANAFATDNGVNVALAQRLVKACRYGTAKVKLYCCQRYDDSSLVNSWSVNEWATAIAAKWLCSRRGNSPPKSIAADAEDAMAELEKVQGGQLSIEDIGTRTSGWPFIVNGTVDWAYDTIQLRQQPLLSEGTPTQFAEYVDWNSALRLAW